MTDKIVLTNLSSLANDTSAIAAINANNAAITTAMDNTLSRDGTSPNQMGASLDMNSNRILNLPIPLSNNEPARFADLGSAQQASTSASASAAAAALSAINAAAEASIAITQSGISTTQAGISTIQAGTAATEAGLAYTSATNAESSATAAAASATAIATGYSDTSTTSNTIGTGSKTFTVSSGKLFTSGQFLIISNTGTPTNYMHGQITSYSGTSLIVNVTDTGGSGTLSSWTIDVSGTQGASGGGVISGLTVNQVPISGGATSITSSVGLTSGQLLVGQTSGAPTANSVSGDATLSSSGVLTVNNSAITNAKLAYAGANSLKGNNTGSSAVVTDLTETQVTAMLNDFVGDSGSGGTKGLVLAPSSGDAAAGKYLKADGSWSSPSSSGGTITTDTYFKSGRPWVDVKSYGALGDGSTDDTTAFSNSITALLGIGGGTLYVPPGTYCLNGGISIGSGSAASIRVVGASTYSTFLTANGHDVTLITLNGFYDTLENMSIWGKGANQSPGVSSESFGATHPAIQVNSSGGTAKLSYLNVLGGSSALYLNGAIEPRIDHCSFAFAYGGAAVYAVNTIALKSYCMSIDQSWPVSVPTAGTLNAPAWGGTTAYSIGNVVTSQGYWLQCKVAGTSGSTAPTLKNYGVNITDGVGSLVWQLVQSSQYFALQLDSGCVEALITKSDFTGSHWAGLATTNSLSTTAPILTHVQGSVFSLNAITNIYFLTGAGLYVYDCEIEGALASGASNVNLSGSGQVIISANLLSNASSTGSAILLSSGSGTIISNNLFVNNITGITVSAGVTNFNITDNMWASGTNSIVVSSGASDYYNIVNNILNPAGAVSDSGSGSNKTVAQNH